MKNLMIIIGFFFSFSAGGQIRSATIQASGLTCSMCSNAIFKALKTLDFVAHVEPNIKNSTFGISFKPGVQVDLDKLKEKVEDAGFFVAKFTVVMNVENLAISNDAHVNVGNEVFHFLNVKDKVLSGEQTFRILDKGFVSAKEFKKNSNLTKMPCYKTGEENLPTGQVGGKRIYHVTI